MSLTSQLIAAPEIAAPITDNVYFTGSTALKKGTLLVWDNGYVTTDTGKTATDNWGGRTRAVALPSTTKCRNVAGLALFDYDAVTGGQSIEIYAWLPNNAVEARVEVISTANSSKFTASVCTDAEGVFFYDGKIPGAGHLTALVNVVVKASTTDLTAGPVAFVTDHGGSITTAGVLTDAGTFTNAVVGDRVIILSAATSAGAAVTDGAAGSVLGEYLISVKTSANVVTLADYTGDATALINYIVVRGYPTIWCRCDADTRETGLLEVIQPIASTAVSPATAVGFSLAAGGTLTAGDSTATLADGTEVGQRKIIHLVGTLGTNNYVVTVTTGFSFTGLTRTAVNTLTMDTATAYFSFIWTGTAWRLEEYVLAGGHGAIA